MGEVIQRAGEYWYQREEDGTWFRWDEATHRWRAQAEPPAVVAGGSGATSPSSDPGPTPGYDYERGTDGTWWARDQRTSQLHWHDSRAGRWVPYRELPSQLQRPAFPYASFWERFLASLVDGTFTGLVGYGVGWIVGSVMLGTHSDEEQVFRALVIAQVIAAAVAWMYYALMECSRWQATVGKKMVGLQVTNMAGQRIGFGRATGRHFAKLLSAVILGIGFLMVAWDPKKQGLHDRAAETLILKRGLNTLRPRFPSTGDQPAL